MLVTSRKQRTTITENVTNPPYLGAQLKKCDLLLTKFLTQPFLQICNFFYPTLSKGWVPHSDGVCMYG